MAVMKYLAEIDLVVILRLVLASCTFSRVLQTFLYVVHAETTPNTVHMCRNRSTDHTQQYM